MAILGGNASASALGLLVFTLLARHLGMTSFGEWVLFTASISLMDLIRTGIIRGGLIRYWALAQDNGQKEELQGTSNLLMIILSIGLAVIVFLIGRIIPELVVAANLKLFFDYYPVYSLLSIPHFLITWRLQAELKFKASNFPRILVNVLMAALTLTLTYSSISVLEISWAYIGFHGLSGVIMIAFYGFNLQSIKRWNRKQLRSLWQFGKSSLATMAGGSLLRSSDVYLLGAFMGPEAVAIYSIPLKLIDLLDIPLRSIVIAHFSEMTKKANGPDFIARLHKLLSQGFFFSLFMIALTLGFSTQILNLFKVTDLELGFQLLLINALTMSILPMEKILGTAFDATGKPDRNAQKVWIMLILNVIGDLLVLTFFPSVLLVATVTVLNQLFGVYFSHRFFPISGKGILDEMLKIRSTFSSKASATLHR